MRTIRWQIKPWSGEIPKENGLAARFRRVGNAVGFGGGGLRTEIELLVQLLVNPAATIVTTPHPAPSNPTCDRAAWYNDGPDMPSSRPLRLGYV